MQTLARVLLPPGVKGLFAFCCHPVRFIADNDIGRRQLIAEVGVRHHFTVQQLAGIEHAQGGAKIDPRLVDGGGQNIENLFGMAEPGRFNQQTIRFPGAAGYSTQPASAGR